MAYFSGEFIDWLDTHADQIDQKSGGAADQLLEKVAAEGVFGLAVPEKSEGKGGSQTEVIGFLSELAQHSLTASFISWGHRTFIENILASSNDYARKTWLPDLLTGKLAARLPWVTNLRSDNFVTIFAASFEDENKKPLILTVPSTAAHLSRSDDLEFVSLQGSNTAALTFNRVPLDNNWILSDDAEDFLAQTRPEFLGYQFGLAFGLAERSLKEVAQNLNSNRSVLRTEYDNVLKDLNTIKSDLFEGLGDRTYFIRNPRQLFQLRIDIVDIVANSLLLELQASGGRGYFKHSTSSFIRRWNEGAFLPIVSPSAVQLRHILETV